MKAVVLLAILGVAAARPQFIYPSVQPVVKVDGTNVRPITYTYPGTTAAGIYPTAFPTTGVYSTFPTTGAYPFTYTGTPFVGAYPSVPYPFVTTSGVQQVEKTGSQSSRTKRSADPEPQPEAEADPYLFYTTGAGVRPVVPFPGTTTYTYPNYPTTFPIATTYTGFPYSGYPYTNFGFPYNYNTFAGSNVVKA